MTTENRLFLETAPVQVIQNLITAIDPALLTEHSLMLLFNDLSRTLPIEELSQRMLGVLLVYMTTENEENEETEEDHPTH